MEPVRILDDRYRYESEKVRPNRTGRFNFTLILSVSLNNDNWCGKLSPKASYVFFARFCWNWVEILNNFIWKKQKTNKPTGTGSISAAQQFLCTLTWHTALRSRPRGTLTWRDILQSENWIETRNLKFWTESLKLNWKLKVESWTLSIELKPETWNFELKVWSWIESWKWKVELFQLNSIFNYYMYDFSRGPISCLNDPFPSFLTVFSDLLIHVFPT
jgi:hypothetical protein